MKLELPDKFAAQLPERDLMVDLAIGMYAAQHLTLGQAAELAGISQSQLAEGVGASSDSGSL